MSTLLTLLMACAPARTGPPDLVLVSIDTLRADHVGAYGGTRGLTPNLDRFAAESVQFQRAWTQANFTLAAHAAVLYGRYASALGPVRGDTRYPPSRETLPALLHLYGYATGGFTGGGMLGDCYGLQHGFDTWQAGDCAAYGSLAQSAPRALAWMAAHEDGPTFTFIHGYDPHQPYLKPAPYGLGWTDPAAPPTVDWPTLQRVHAIFDGQLSRRDEMTVIDSRLRPWDSVGRALVAGWFDRHPADRIALTPADHAALRDGYAGGVAYADAWFGWMMNELARTGRLEHTVVVVMSDHGESLGEDGRYGHAHTLEERVGHVPLMVRLPGPPGDHTHARKVEADVALFDLFPTLLELAGATVPAGLPSRTLGPLLRGEAAAPRGMLFTEGKEAAVAGREGDELLVFSGLEAQSPRLPALLAAAALDGPAFAESRVSSPERREALRADLLVLTRALPRGAAGAVTDPATLDAMRKHGYFERP